MANELELTKLEDIFGLDSEIQKQIFRFFCEARVYLAYYFSTLPEESDLRQKIIDVVPEKDKEIFLDSSKNLADSDILSQESCENEILSCVRELLKIVKE